MQIHLRLAILAGTGLMATTGCFQPHSTALVRLQSTPEGTYQVIARDFERDGAEMAANQAANAYCEEAGRRTIFVDERCDYTGSLDEGTRNVLRRASQAVFGTPIAANNKRGSAVVTAGALGEAVTDNRDYKAQVVFRCE